MPLLSVIAQSIPRLASHCPPDAVSSVSYHESYAPFLHHSLTADIHLAMYDDDLSIIHAKNNPESHSVRKSRWQRAYSPRSSANLAYIPVNNEIPESAPAPGVAGPGCPVLTKEVETEEVNSGARGGIIAGSGTVEISRRSMLTYGSERGRGGSGCSCDRSQLVIADQNDVGARAARRGLVIRVMNSFSAAQTQKYACRRWFTVGHGIDKLDKLATSVTTTGGIS